MTGRRPIMVSSHAVDRYIERWEPMLSYGQASGYLRALLSNAEFVEAEQGTNQSIWRIPPPTPPTDTFNRSMLLVVDNDTGLVRTVLPRGATNTTYRPEK